MRFIEPWQWLKARQKKVERVSRFIDPRVKAGSVDKDGASFGVITIEDPWAKVSKVFHDIEDAELRYIDDQLDKWLDSNDSAFIFGEVMLFCQTYNEDFQSEWSKVLKRKRKQFKKEYRRKKEMTPTGKTEVSKELHRLLVSSDNWDGFEESLDSHQFDGLVRHELSQIYALEAKNISGYSAEKCAFVHLRVNGYVIKQEPKYRIILPDLHQVKTVTHWNYVFVSEFGTVQGTDHLDDVPRLTEEQLTKLPSWLKAYAQEVK